MAFPCAGLIIGVAMVELGVWLLLTHRTLGITAARQVVARPRRDLSNPFVFGVAYTVGSLGCTLPVFLVVLGGSLAAEGILFSLGQFVSYALGMGSVIIVVSGGAALFRRAVFDRLRRLPPHIHRLSGKSVVGVGVCLVYYWVFQGGIGV